MALDHRRTRIPSTSQRRKREPQYYFNKPYDIRLVPGLAVVPTMKTHSAPEFEAKICSPTELVCQVLALPRPLVFTNGVFDILHRGHVTYLAQARALGASMILALNTDASVKRLNKGDDRPINTLADRMAVVAALSMVDRVTFFEDDTPLKLILACRPDVVVKGGDWPVERIVGADEVQSWGGEVVSIPLVHQRSTTEILKKIQA